MLLSQSNRDYILKLNRKRFRYKFLVFVYRRAVSRLIIESIRTQLLMDSRAASPWSGLRRTGGGVGLGVGSRVLTS